MQVADQALKGSMKGSMLMEVNITHNRLFHFTRPKFDLGQKVKTRDGLTGYIVGLDFYPETETWSYGVYLLNDRDELVEEIWYEADQIKIMG
jgi:hypothetical protein